MIAALMFMTLAAAAGAGLVAFLGFIRSSRNRQTAEHALVGESDYTWSHLDGALPDQLALAAIVVVAMLLLAAGYMIRAV